jgi:type IV/VI secretion system ImpK/VasF family protein
MLDAGDKSDERLPLMRAFVTAFAYAEQLRERYVKPAAGETPDESGTQGAAEPQRVADALATQLQAATRKLARDAMAWTGAAGEADIAAAQYAYVALLDERLLFSAWPGASMWEAQPLEARIFGTRAAGERLPDAIETLLAQRDPAQRDLANVYLACLTLGFKGRLRGESGALRHDQLRHALFAFSVQRDPEPERIAAPLELAALAPRETRALTQMFPDRARLALFLGGGCVALVGVSQLLWLFATAPVGPALDQFEAVSLAGARVPHTSTTSTSGVVLPLPRPRSGTAPRAPAQVERGSPWASTEPQDEPSIQHAVLAAMPLPAGRKLVGAGERGAYEGYDKDRLSTAEDPNDQQPDTPQPGARP